MRGGVFVVALLVVAGWLLKHLHKNPLGPCGCVRRGTGADMEMQEKISTSKHGGPRSERMSRGRIAPAHRSHPLDVCRRLAPLQANMV